MVKMRVRTFFSGLQLRIPVPIKTLTAIGLVIFLVVSLQATPRQPPPGSRIMDIKREDITLLYPEGWAVVSSQFANAHELHKLGPEAGRAPHAGPVARILVTTDEGRDHLDAVRALREIALESKSPSTFMNIGGWPGLQRRQKLPVERPESLPDPGIDATYLRVTTAVAAGAVLVRLEAVVPDPAAQALADEIDSIGRSLAFAKAGDRTEVEHELDELRGSLQIEPETTGSKPLEAGADVLPSPREESAILGPEANVRVNAGVGFDSEIEVAVSRDGQNIVIGNNSRDYSFSNNGGANVTAGGVVPVPAGFLGANGDPSLAWGQSGAFYFAFIGYPDVDGTLAQDECSTAISRSTDNGQNFAFRANAVHCSDAAGPQCFPDQEHIAADRFNAAPGGDQVYSVWRHFTGGTCNNTAAGPVATMVCSSDGGLTWTAAPFVTIDAAGDRPRVTVGQDGFVYVVYRAGNLIRLRKYSSCTNGLMPQGLAVTVASALPDDAAACPVAGIDRCSAPFVSSQTVAVDDTDPNHIYVAYAYTSTADTNDEIRVRDSRDGGVTWDPARVARISGPATARRFMPWVCSVGGAAHVGWYDRRNSTAADNSLTDYFVGSASLDASGNLKAGAEIRVSQVSDSGCASGWTCQPRASADSDSCTAQPQLAGICCTAGPSCAAGDSRNACDFSDCSPPGIACTCVGAEVCKTGGGCPKYGDYSGIACAAGRLFAAWASATSPPGILPASGDIDAFLDILAKDLVIRDLTISSASVAAGQSVTVAYRVLNQGTLSVNEDYKEKVQLESAQPPVVLGESHIHTVDLAPAGSHNASRAFTIPPGTPPGAYSLVVKGDTDNRVIESIESNNDSPTALTVTAGKDLVIQNLAISPASAASGQAVRVTYRVANTGSVLVTEDFKESISLRHPNGTETLLASSHLHTEDLSPQETHDASKNVTLPSGLSADPNYAIVVQADSKNAVLESDENNKASSPLSVVTGTKNIVIEELAVSPAMVSPGGGVNVTYKIFNRGNITITENFKEEVRIVLHDATGTRALLGTSHLHTDDLSQDQFHASTKTYTLPGGLTPGTYTILVIGDSTGAVVESDENNEASTTVEVQ